MTDMPSRADFAAHTGEPFLIRFDSGETLPLTLAAVRDLGEHVMNDVTIESFALDFHGPLQPVLPQQTYPLQHATLGELLIFIVPIGPGEGVMQYEAVFG